MSRSGRRPVTGPARSRRSGRPGRGRRVAAGPGVRRCRPGAAIRSCLLRHLTSYKNMTACRSPSVARVPSRCISRSVAPSRGRIGRAGPGARLPTEQAYAREFGVSIAPVRQALLDLADAGLIVRHKGRDVRPRQPRRGGDRPPHELHRQPPPARRPGPDAGPGAGRASRPDPEVAGALGLRPGPPVVRLRRLAWIGDEPAALLDAWLPARPFGGLAIADRLRGRPLRSTRPSRPNTTSAWGLRAAGIEVGRCTEEEARLLGLPEGRSLLRSRRSPRMSSAGSSRSPG